MRFMLPPDRGAVRGSARAAVLADWLTSWNGTSSQVTLAPSYRALAEAIENGEVDAAWAPPAVCARVHRRVHSLLSVVRYGATDCSAALVVRKGARIRAIRDLAGKRASWVDPLSTSGHLMALAYLRDEGFDAEKLFTSQRFAGSYRDALVDVIEERSDVTSVFVVASGVEATLKELVDLAGLRAKELRLLATTPPAPYDALVITRAAKDPSALGERLLGLDQRDSPPAMLLEVCRADRFLRATPGAYAHLERFVSGFID